MLANIRKPYLNVESHATPLTRHKSRNNDLGDASQMWAGIRHLTNAERDQIDLQSRLILTRCAERVKEMESLEKSAFHNMLGCSVSLTTPVQFFIHVD